MSQPTKQDMAIAAALQVAGLMTQFVGLLQSAQQLSNRITQGNYLTLLQALPTAPWAADGTQGTQDATPTGTDPIVTQGLYLPANDVTAGVYMLNDFVAFMGNGAVATQDRSATAAKLIR